MFDEEKSCGRRAGDRAHGRSRARVQGRDRLSRARGGRLHRRPQDRGLRPLRPSAAAHSSRRSSDHLRHISEDTSHAVAGAHLPTWRPTSSLDTAPFVVINLDKVDVIYARDTRRPKPAADAATRPARPARHRPPADARRPVHGRAAAAHGALRLLGRRRARRGRCPSTARPRVYVAYEELAASAHGRRHDDLSQHACCCAAPRRSWSTPASTCNTSRSCRALEVPRPGRRRPRLHRPHPRPLRPRRRLRRRARPGGRARARARRPRPAHGGRHRCRASGCGCSRATRASWRTGHHLGAHAGPHRGRRVLPRRRPPTAWSCSTGDTIGPLRARLRTQWSPAPAPGPDPVLAVVVARDRARGARRCSCRARAAVSPSS